MTKWVKATLVDVPDGALATDMEGLSVLLIVNDDGFVVSWSLNIGGAATLPDVEEIAAACAVGMSKALEQFDFTWTDRDA